MPKGEKKPYAPLIAFDRYAAITNAVFKYEQARKDDGRRAVATGVLRSSAAIDHEIILEMYEAVRKLNALSQETVKKSSLVPNRGYNDNNLRAAEVARRIINKWPKMTIVQAMQAALAKGLRVPKRRALTNQEKNNIERSFTRWCKAFDKRAGELTDIPLLHRLFKRAAVRLRRTDAKAEMRTQWAREIEARPHLNAEAFYIIVKLRDGTYKTIRRHECMLDPAAIAEQMFLAHDADEVRLGYAGATSPASADVIFDALPEPHLRRNLDGGLELTDDFNELLRPRKPAQGAI